MTSMLSSHTCFFVLALILQAVLIIYLLQSDNHGVRHVNLQRIVERSHNSNIENAIAVELLDNKLILATEIKGKPIVEAHMKNPEGCAVTLMLESPKWWQRRYTQMINNIRANLPENWIVQIFYSGSKQAESGIDINPGLKRLIRRGEVKLTLIPASLIKEKPRKILLMLDPWLWENMAADKVLIFGGNSAICSNSPYEIANFTTFEYIGAPWNKFNGYGGEGEISIRNRKLMLSIIHEELNKPDHDHFSSWGMEDEFFVKRLKERYLHNKNSDVKIKLATREDCQRFGSSADYVNLDALVASGTLAGVSFEDRSAFLDVCLDLKMIYPSLHDPNCFGAHPNGEKCAENICALRNPPKKGGC